MPLDLAITRDALREKVQGTVLADWDDWRREVLTGDDPDDKRKFVEASLRVLGFDADKKDPGAGRALVTINVQDGVFRLETAAAPPTPEAEVIEALQPKQVAHVPQPVAPPCVDTLISEVDALLKFTDD